MKAPVAIAVRRFAAVLGLTVLFGLSGCRALVERTDRQVAQVIAARQEAALGQQTPARIPVDEDELRNPPRRAYDYSPHAVGPDVPAGFRGQLPATAPATQESVTGSTTSPAATPALPASDGAPATAPDGTAPDRGSDEPRGGVPGDALAGGPTVGTMPTTAPGVLATRPADPDIDLFTLTEALAYAQENRRAYQTAKEDLYLVALALTLERHLWTPIFASNLRTVYGNFGEIRDFDQAMRFVADLSVSQRLPYGGEFTAAAISTLIRDVKKSITAAEGGTIEVGLNIPFLRGAGHVAREDLIQLERELTYAVRSFERFRRAQLVDVASAYFDLLREKQRVLDSEASLSRRALIFDRTQEFEKRGLVTPLETQRAEFDYLSGENRLERQREFFRAQADQFKLLIGMPVDRPLPLARLETIEAIEARVLSGEYPLLLRPEAVEDESRALGVAIEHRLDLLNQQDRIDDARRGVDIAKNSLLPDLDLISTITWDTDPNEFSLGQFSFDRTTWRSELILSLPLERTAERNAYRRALIDVRQAQRSYRDTLERIRAQVRSAVNQIYLQERSLVIQRRNLEVSERRREYARIRYYRFGDIEVRELLEAEDAWTAARNDLNAAKTARWAALLDFRLATETLRIDDDGVQYEGPELSEPLQVPDGGWPPGGR